MSKINLCVKTCFHVIYFVILIIVAITGIRIIFECTRRKDEDPTGMYARVSKTAAFYLTNWNITFQTIFLFLSVVHDVLQWADKHKTAFGLKLRYCRDVIFNAIVVPFSFFVFSMFWGLYAIDRELVFPKVYDDVVPWWFNQCVHTNIIILVAVETFLQARREPTNRRLEISINIGIGIFYAIVMYSIYFFANRWLYNVFGLLTWWQICIYQIGIWASSYLFYIMHFPINRLIHGKRKTRKEEFNGNTAEKNGNTAPKSGNTALKGGNTEAKSGKVALKNGNAEPKNGNVALKSATESAENNNNEKSNNIFTISHSSSEMKIPSLSTSSWSLKYRNLRNQFANSSL